MSIVNGLIKIPPNIDPLQNYNETKSSCKTFVIKKVWLSAAISEQLKSNFRQ